MVPIHLPPADKPSETVLAAEKALLERDGVYHVGELYFANVSDAEKVRRIAAERIVHEEERQAKLVCAFCSERITGNVAVVIAMKPVHPKCAAEFDAWIYGQVAAASVSGMPDKRETPEVPLPLDEQLRKSIELGRIQDDDIIEWGSWVDEDTPFERYEFELVPWRDLSTYERHTVERDADGKLRGGYPI